MASLRETRFTAWDLSEQELREGAMLSDLAVKRIQNMQSQAAEKVLNLRVDPANPGSFAVEQAYLSGQVHLAQALIDDHRETLVQVNSSQPLSEG